MKDIEIKELEEASRPLVEYIRKKHTPMTTAIVTGVRADLLYVEIGTTFSGYDEECNEELGVDEQIAP